MFPITELLSIGTKLIDKLIPDPEQKAKLQLELTKLAQEGKLADLKADMNEQDNVSKRWEADATTDSRLAKNIRPLTLVYILTAYLGFAIADGAGFMIAPAYVELLGQWGMLVMSAYFGGRTLEKIMELKGKK
jgi:hypothetical protein